MPTNTVCQSCRVTHTVIVPTVHLNGTNGHDLLDQLGAVHDALLETRRVMRLAAPHGRDYYPQGEAATQLATEQHERRYQGLGQMLTEIGELYGHVVIIMNSVGQPGALAATEVR